MADQSLNLILKAVDQASNVISKVQGNITKFSDSSVGSLGKVSKKFEEVGTKMQGLGQKLAPLSIAIGGLATASVFAFDKQAKALSQVEAGLRSTGESAGFGSQELQKMATDLQNLTRFGDETILQDVTAQLLTFTNITGDAFSRTQVAALDLATRLDGDLKSASIQLGKALNDPVANLSALSRSGIQFSEDQKAMINSLVETNRLADAQTLILDELEKQYGGSAEAAAKAGAGGIIQLKNSIGDATEEIGKIITEGIQPLVKFVQEAVIKFQNLNEGTKKVIVIVGALVAGLAPLLAIIGTLSIVIGAALPVIAAVGIAIAGITAPVAMAVGAIGLLTVVVAKNFDKIKNFVGNAMDKTSEFIAASWQDKLRMLGEFGQKFVQVNSAIYQDILANIVVALKKIGEVLMKGLEIWAGVGDKFVTFFVERFTALRDWLSNLDLLEVMNSIGSSILDGLIGVGSKMVEAAKRIGQAFKSALKGDLSGFDLSDLLFGDSESTGVLNKIAGSKFMGEIENMQKQLASGLSDAFASTEFGFSNTQRALGGSIQGATALNQVEALDTAPIEENTTQSIKQLQQLDKQTTELTENIQKSTGIRIEASEDEKEEMKTTAKTHGSMASSMIRGNNTILENVSTTVEQMKVKYQELKGVLDQIRSITAPKDEKDTRTDAQVFAISGAQKPISDSVFGATRRASNQQAGIGGLAAGTVSTENPININISRVDSPERVGSIESAVTRAMQLSRQYST